MTVLDAYAVIAYLRGEPAAGEVLPLFGPGSALTATGLAEVIDQLVRGLGIHVDEVMLDLAQLDLLTAIPVGADLGVDAGRLRSTHYHRTRCTVSMSDCVAAAAASARDEPLATSDPHLLDLCHREGTAVIVLPGSAGTRWTPPASS